MVRALDEWGAMENFQREKVNKLILAFLQSLIKRKLQNYYIEDEKNYVNLAKENLFECKQSYDSIMYLLISVILSKEINFFYV